MKNEKKILMQEIALNGKIISKGGKSAEYAYCYVIKLRKALKDLKRKELAEALDVMFSKYDVESAYKIQKISKDGL